MNQAPGVKLSIVVPAYNESKLIVETLRSIRAAVESLSERGWASEVIVCDNNSTDDTAALAREEGARVVFEPVNQIGRARNTGAAHAGGDWLLFVDADSCPSGALFADVAAAIESGQVLAGGSTVRIETSHRMAARLMTLWNFISRTRRLMAGSFIFCEAAGFRALGGFNLKLFAGEEIDLSKRLKRLARQQGKRIVILDQHPLLTSARKIHLYSRREQFRFLLKTFAGLGRTLRSAKECTLWYDGRR